MSHGDARAGAGRPRGQGNYGEATQTVRIPLGCTLKMAIFLFVYNPYQGLKWVIVSVSSNSDSSVGSD